MKALLLLLVFAPEPTSPIDEAHQLYNRGTTLYEAADYDGAIEAFTDSLDTAQELPEPQAKPIRIQLLYNIALAHEKAYDIDKDASHLRKAHKLLQRYVDEIADMEDALDGEVSLRRIEKKLRALETINANKARAKEGPPPPPSVDPQPQTDKKRRGLGIGLLVAGGAATAGGLGILAAGATLGPKAEANVHDVTGGDMMHDAWEQGQEHIQNEQRRGAILMGVGGGVTAIGVAGVVVGAIQVKKSREQITFAPSIGQAFTGLTVSGRF